MTRRNARVSGRLRGETGRIGRDRVNSCGVVTLGIPSDGDTTDSGDAPSADLSDAEVEALHAVELGSRGPRSVTSRTVFR